MLYATEENQTQKSSKHIVDSIFHHVVLVDEQSFKVEPTQGLLVYILVTVSN